MRTTLTCLLAIAMNFSLFSQPEATYTPVRHFVFPKAITDNGTNEQPAFAIVPEQICYIFNFAYTSCIDKTLNLPIWVSHHINKSALAKNYNKRPSGYPEDSQYKTLKRSAYEGSGYDHGHLAPAADFVWNREAYLQSFYMTNMSPQNACFNQKGWCHLEGTIREWALESPFADFYIVSGAVINEFIDTLCLKDNIQVFVPRYYYKVIMITSKDKAPFSIGYIMPNEDIDNFTIGNYSVTVDSVENLTGLDFFSFLPVVEQEAAESVIPEVKYYFTNISCSNKKCEKIYSGKTKPETRKKHRCY